MFTRKAVIFAGLVLSLLLSACSGAAATPAASIAKEPIPTETPAPVEGEPTLVPFTASGPATCTVQSVLPELDPTQQAMFPAITEKDHRLGEASALVTFMEYSDLQCPYCAQLEPVLTQLYQDYPEDVSLIFRHFPLSIHDKAVLAGQAAEAAAVQGKFFEMKDALFAAQAEWGALSAEEFSAYAKEKAKALELDVDQFAADLESDAVKAPVQQGLDEAMKIGIPGTPFLIINGRPYQGPRDYNSLEAIIRLIRLGDRQFKECPEMAIDPAKTYTATFKTTQGDIVVELFAKQAPFAVNSFVFLAQNGWFDDIIWHRVMPGFVAQAGDPSGSGYGGPGYAFSNEVTPELRFDTAGILGMANAGPDSNGSQFFITMAPQPALDGQYTVFGKVISGMDVVEKLTPRDPAAGGELPAGDKILTISITEQ